LISGKQWNPSKYFANEINVYGDKVLENQRSADSINANDIWKNYIKAIGGVENLKKVNDRSTIMESNINGHNIVMTIYQKAPDKMKQIITTSAITQNIFFDGSKGIMEVGSKKTNITGSELEKLKYESIINFIINIDSLGVKINYAGIEKVNNNNSYKIELLLPSGSKIFQYFDVKTSLKIKQVEDVTAAQKTYQQETYFDDYREVKGVKYPYSIRESLGAQVMDVRVTSIKINSGLDDSLFNIK
jgi:phosphotransferase system IIB component